MVATLTPLATWQDFESFGSNAELVQNEEIWTQVAKTRLMVRATRRIESRCQRRLAPFTAKVESQRAYGISPDEYGEQGDMPMDLSGALGWSQAAALGVSSMVREFWLEEYAPMYPELWTYDLVSIEILRTFGDTSDFQASDFAALQGPELDTGHCRVQIGTYCPVGSTIRITYGGGYTAEIPDDLNMACVLQATKLILVGAEPELRKGMDAEQLDEELADHLVPYAKS